MAAITTKSGRQFSVGSIVWNIVKYVSGSSLLNIVGQHAAVRASRRHGLSRK